MNFLNYTEAAPSIYFEPAARDQRDCSAASEHEQINSRRAPGAHLVGREQVQVPPQGWARGRPLAVGAGDPERRDPGGGGRSHRATRRRTGEGRRDDRVGVSCVGGSRGGQTALSLPPLRWGRGRWRWWGSSASKLSKDRGCQRDGWN